MWSQSGRGGLHGVTTGCHHTGFKFNWNEPFRWCCSIIYNFSIWTLGRALHTTMIGCRLIFRITRRRWWSWWSWRSSFRHWRQADAITTCNKEHPNCGICDSDLGCHWNVAVSLNEPRLLAPPAPLQVWVSVLVWVWVWVRVPSAPQSPSHNLNHQALHPHASKQELMLLRRSGDRLPAPCHSSPPKWSLLPDPRLHLFRGGGTVGAVCQMCNKKW